MNTNSSTLPVGTILNRKYHIQSHLSSGGFGNTYLAVYGACNTKVAIKEFFMRTANLREADGKTVSVDDSKEDAKLFLPQLEKFKKEAKRLQQISNAYVVKVYDLFEENGTAYYVMDFVEGYDLESRLKRRGQPYTEIFVSNFLYRILDALSAIHSAGLLHLDLKPANIMMPRGYIKLIDLGASKEYVAGKGATIFSGIAMTPAYAAPEQIDGTYEKLGPWTDFYSLGATLYRMLTNKVPPSISDLYEDKSDDKHTVLSMPNVSEKMRGLVVWMMQLDRTKRPQKASDIKKCLNSSKYTPYIPDKYTYQQPKNADDNTIIEKVPKLSVSKNILRFDAEGNGDLPNIYVDTNQKWEVSCMSQWVDIKKFGNSFRVYVIENNEQNERVSLIKITAGRLVKTIDVVQKGKIYLAQSASTYKEPTNTENKTTEKGNSQNDSCIGTICYIIFIIISCGLVKQICLWIAQYFQ